MRPNVPRRTISKKRLVDSKWSHDFSCVGLDNARKDRDRSRDGLLGEETKDSKHGQSSIVNFLDEPLGFVFFRSVLGELKGIVKVERDEVGNVVEGRVLTRLSSLGVVGSVSVVAKFGVPLEETNESDDLNLGSHGKCIPLLRRGQINARWRVSSEGGPREDKVRLNNVSNEGSHGNTAVPAKVRIVN